MQSERAVGRNAGCQPSPLKRATHETLWTRSLCIQQSCEVTLWSNAFNDAIAARPSSFRWA